MTEDEATRVDGRRLRPLTEPGSDVRLSDDAITRILVAQAPPVVADDERRDE